MQSYSNKNQKKQSKSSATANNTVSNSQTQTVAQLADNRSEAILQRQMQNIADDNTTQLKSQFPVQRVSMEEEDEIMQGKMVAQRVNMEEEEEEVFQGKMVAQRVNMEEEEEEVFQGKMVAQRVNMEEEEEEVFQGKMVAQRVSMEEEDEVFQAKSITSSDTLQRQVSPNNTGLPDNLKSGIENLSGYSMDDVKVHYNSDRPAQLNAHAYAQGTDIHIASGQEKHLPHEAWHVVQQKQGRVKPTMQMKGKINVNDDAGLEREADVMGDKAVQLFKKNGSDSKA